MNNDTNLKDLLSYCLGYIKLINPSLSRYKLSSGPITDYLNKENFFHLNNANDNQILVDLKEFYELNPKELTEEQEEKYIEQKSVAVKLEEIKNKYKVDEYTKQINLNFGYFKVQIPEDVEVEIVDREDEGVEKDEKKYQKDEEYPLFYLPINIEFIQNKYYLTFPEQNIIPNVGFLSGVLTDDNYFELIELLNQLEESGELTLPINDEVINKIWEFLKAKLKLSKAEFNEESFILDKFIVSLSAKSNFFLSSDLKNLLNIDESDLVDTSLGSWISDEDLSNETPVSEEGGELFFPFDYDKYQLRALSVINNKAAIIEGPPGTGKSQTISNLLCHLAANGKRVLFLSQKAQALKVVKDKLKKLEVDYLYGYIPNRSSSLYSIEEEADGAAYSLSGISQFINESAYYNKKSPTISDKKLKDIESEFSDSIETQRKFTSLRDRYLEICKYKIDPLDYPKYLERFNQEELVNINNLRKAIDEVSCYCGSYVKSNNSIDKLDKKYETVLSNSITYESVLQEYGDGLDKIFYDRGDFIATITNKILLIKLKPIADKLPREIYEDISKILDDKTLYKNDKVGKIKELKEYFKFKNSAQKHKDLKQEYELKLIELGLSTECVNKLDELIKEAGEENTIKLTKEVIELEKEISNLNLTNPNEINKVLKKSVEDNKTRVNYYLKNRIRDQIVSATVGAHIKGIIARIAKALTKSKKAYRTFDTLKNDPINFKTIKELVPVWIMDLEDASRLIPLEKNLFDYIILDEASQCNLAYAMPAMYRSKRVIFFGDSFQMRDDSIRFKTNRSLEELAAKYHIQEHLRIKSKEDSVKSVLDIGTLRGFKKETLLNHYRSPKELIGFSNEYFYAPKRRRLVILNTDYVLAPGTNRILVNHIVEPKKFADKSDKTNIAEAEYIVKLVEKLRKHPSNKNKSIGVLTFFNEQATLLKEYLKDESIKVSIIEGIQGDERDIIIYSFVISSPDQKKKYVYLTGEGGEINKDLNAGRVNVAFSRARIQVHCVTSLAPESWPEGIWIKKYLEYVNKNGEINFFNTKLSDFDSKFEENFYHFINSEIGSKVIIQNQVESCGFKIDFVVTNPVNNRRLAIECDGPTHFEDENSDMYVVSDIERQNILEKAKWNFYRIAYSMWLDDSYDKNQIIEEISEALGLNEEPVIFEEPDEDIEKFETDKDEKDEIKSDTVKEPAKESQTTIKAKKIIETPSQLGLLSEDKKLVTKTIKKKTKNSKSTFKDILRFNYDEYRDLVVSVSKNKLMWINEYSKNGDYIGFTQKGFGFLINEYDEFINKTLDTIKNNTENKMRWLEEGNATMNITPITNPLQSKDLIDIRKYVTSDKYTGYTKKGFRFEKEKLIEFLKELKNAKSGLK